MTCLEARHVCLDKTGDLMSQVAYSMIATPKVSCSVELPSMTLRVFKPRCMHVLLTIFVMSAAC